MSEQEWRVGQKVAVFYRNELTGFDVIKRVGKTIGLTKDARTRFGLDGLHKARDSWQYSRIVPATEQHFREMKRRNAAYTLSKTDWSKCSLDTLDGALKLLEADAQGAAQKGER